MSLESLSQNDVDLLLGGPDRGEAALTGARRHSVEAIPYDFRRPHRVSKEQLRTLEAMYERLVKTLEGWLLGRVRGKVELTLQGVEQFTFGEFALSMPTPCCTYLLDVHHSGGQQGVIEFGHEFAYFLIDRLLGGRHEPHLPQRSLTMIEQLVVRTVAERAAAGMNEIWHDDVGLGVSLSSFESTPEILRASGGDEAVLVATVSISAAEMQSLMSICLPYSVFDSYFAGGHFFRRGSLGVSEEERKANRDVVAGSLRSTRVSISARFPEFRIPLRSLTALQEGSVLATSVLCDSEVELLVAGQSRYRGTAARAGRRLAVRLNDTLAAGGAGQKTDTYTQEERE